MQITKINYAKKLDLKSRETLGKMVLAFNSHNLAKRKEGKNKILKREGGTKNIIFSQEQGMLFWLTA